MVRKVNEADGCLAVSLVDGEHDYSELATALVQARRSGVFTAEHEAFWAAARTALGDTAGTRELVEVLLLHRRGAHRDVIAGIAAALAVGAVRADVVAVEVRRLAQAWPRTIAELPSPHRDTARVVSLTQRRLSDPEATFATHPAAGPGGRSRHARHG